MLYGYQLTHGWNPNHISSARKFLRRKKNFKNEIGHFLPQLTIVKFNTFENLYLTQKELFLQQNSHYPIMIIVMNLFRKNRENHILEVEFVKIREFTPVIIAVIFPLK